MIILIILVLTSIIKSNYQISDDMIKRDRPHDRVTNLSGASEAELPHKTVVGDCLSSTVKATD